MAWTKGTHTWRFGGNWYREVNQYWDPPEGYTIINLGLDQSDPAREVQQSEHVGEYGAQHDAGQHVGHAGPPPLAGHRGDEREDADCEHAGIGLADVRDEIAKP